MFCVIIPLLIRKILQVFAEIVILARIAGIQATAMKYQYAILGFCIPATPDGMTEFCKCCAPLAEDSC
jgi:hypothetical protein